MVIIITLLLLGISTFIGLSYLKSKELLCWRKDTELKAMSI